MNAFEATHAGMVVENLEEAMQALTTDLGLTWAPVQNREISLWFRGTDIVTDLGFTYSVQGPPHLELLTAQPGTPWEMPGMHHVGFWSEDLARDVADGVASGSEMEVTYSSATSGPVGFAYLTTPTGLRVEYVDAARRTAFNEWLAGGSFPAVGRN